MVFPSKLTLCVTDSNSSYYASEESISGDESSISVPRLLNFSKDVVKHGKSKISDPWNLLFSVSLLPHG